MATLAETPSHGRLPKSLNTKLVKLFPSGLLVYTTEKPPRFRGWNALVSLIIVAYFITVYPHASSLLCLVAVFCCLQYPTGSLKACLRNCLGGFHELMLHHTYTGVVMSLFIMMAPVSLHPVFHLSGPYLLVHQSVSCHAGGMLGYAQQPVNFLGATEVGNRAACMSLLEMFIYRQRHLIDQHSSIVSSIVVVIDPAFFSPFLLDSLWRILEWHN